ncbi:MarR family winged helix-turn-helix transcriptional regulator [Rhizobium sp. CF142]|uniref:MarR family winged helix-turn-helix transcriptional regulator n=1 Tax=Rhizobium sp. CF142 TaxID=1144314 RepID=UPI00026EF247|nr:MarR family transcriptional regulator [Rhizobium sp. CF142]EJJ30683.1 transcriptional regulator [Rhizobium sp. CF142]
MPKKSTDRLARYIPTVQLFSARLVLFHQKMAEKVGLTGTEFKCFRLLEQLGPLSMTALSREVGLKVGTVSGLIDKLETTGFVVRRRDETDKRRLVLVACPEASARASRLYEEHGEAMAAMLETYSEADFNLLLSFLTDVGNILARSSSSAPKEPHPERTSDR